MRSLCIVRRLVGSQARNRHQHVRIVPLPKEELLPDAARHHVVLIDVQRATSTLVTGFASGLRSAWILKDVAAVRKVKEDELLGGEENFVKIPDFDLDNSPRAYTREVCEDRDLLFTSTNGAKALATLDKKTTVCLGSFLNLAATQHFCLETNVVLLCSGTHGERSDEDELFAGTVAAYLHDHGVDLADKVTKDCVDVALHAQAFPAFWHRLMTDSTNARGLISNGLQDDIPFVSQINKFPNILPIRRPSDHRFRNVPPR